MQSSGLSNDRFGRPATGGSTISNITAFLGPPGKEVRYNAEDDVSKEFFSVADTYRGRNVFLEKTISAMVARSNNPWVLQRFFKLEQFNDTNFSMIVLKANRTLFVRTAPHAPPTYVSAKEASITASMGRYELAFIVPIETLDTADGQAKARLHITNMSAALGDTMEQASLESLLAVKNVWREYTRKSHKPVPAIEGLAKDEVAGWDILRKYEDGSGFLKAWAEVQAMMRDYYVTAAIAPQDAKILMSGGSSSTHFRLHGAGARNNAILASDSAAANADGIMDVFVVRQFTLDQDKLRTQTMHRTREIGAHVRSSDYSAKCKPNAYRGCSRDIMGFTMANLNGRHVTLPFADSAFKYGMRFNPDGTLTSFHAKLASDPAGVARRLKLPVENDFYDMFVYRDPAPGENESTHKVVKVLGQMEPLAMSYETLRLVAETMRERQLEALGTDGERAIAEGQALIDELYENKITDNHATLLRNLVNVSGAARNGVMSGNAQGGVDLSSVELTEDWNALAHGSAVGLFSLAAQASHPNVKRNTPADKLARAVAFTGAYNRWFDATVAMLAPDHPLVSGEFVDAHANVNATGTPARIQNARNTIASSLFDWNKAPLVFTGTRGAGVVAGSATAELARPLYGASSESEQERVIDAVRAVAAPYATERVRATLASRDSVATFLADYETSSFAEAFGRHASEATSSSAARKASATDKSFAMFASTKLVALISTSGAGAAGPAIAGIMDGLVDSLAQNRAMRPNQIDSSLRRWTATGTSAAATSSSSAASTSTLITRLVVSPSRLAEAAVSDFAIAHPLVANTLVTHANEPALNLDSRTHAHRAFARTHLWKAASTAAVTGAKRSVTSGATMTADDIANTNIAKQKMPTGTSALVRTNQFAENWKSAGAEASRLIGANIQLLLLAPVKRQTFERLHAANVRVPLDVLIETPFMTWEAASMLFISETPGFAKLAWAKYNVMMAPNMANQTITGMMSIWFVPIPMHDDRFLLFEDCMVTGYRHGQDFSPIMGGFAYKGKGRGTGSSFFMVQPYGSLRGTRVPHMHDIRGAFSGDFIAGGRLTPDANNKATKSVHHPSAFFYGIVHNLDMARTLNVDAADAFPRSKHIDNTITFQHSQRMFNLTTEEFDRAIINTGHQGPNIYDGYGRDVTSRGTYIKDMHYEQKFSPED